MTRLCNVLLLATVWMGPAVAAAIPVRIATTLGTIIVEVDAQRAPATVANFLRYVDRGAYDGGAFHRTVTLANQPDSPIKIEVIQAGVNPALHNRDDAPIVLERTRDTGLRHLAGTISMARDAPDSATSDFFICIADQPELDFGGSRNPDGQGFAAFGRVTGGMDVVRKIQRAKARGQALDPPIGIIAIKRAPPAARQ